MRSSIPAGGFFCVPRSLVRVISPPWSPAYSCEHIIIFTTYNKGYITELRSEILLTYESYDSYSNLYGLVATNTSLSEYWVLKKADFVTWEGLRQCSVFWERSICGDWDIQIDTTVIRTVWGPSLDRSSIIWFFGISSKMVITREEKRMWPYPFSLSLVSLGPTYNRELFLQRTNI